MADTEFRFHAPSTRRMIPAAIAALRRWWAAGRHYRPERRYMRGGGTHA